jgi:penicillin-insensitive murein endopeptidase
VKKDAKGDAKDAKKDGPKKVAKAGKGKAHKDPSISIGAPNRGKLQHGSLLKGSKTLKQKTSAHSWGHATLVKLLHRAADKVAKSHKGSVLFVGDLSKKEGGRLDGHNSHQSGRDADLGFYTSNSKGGATYVGRFVKFDGQGKANGGASIRFDDARNWALVEALLSDKDAEIRYLFVSPGLRTRLVQYATQKKVSKDLILKAAAALVTPKDADPHDDHFHVRIRCPKNSVPGCYEESFGGGDAAPAKDGEDPKADPKAPDAKDEPKADPPKPEPVAKPEPPKAEPPKPDAPKPDAPKAEPPKAEPPKAEPPKQS